MWRQAAAAAVCRSTLCWFHSAGQPACVALGCLCPSSTLSPSPCALQSPQPAASPPSAHAPPSGHGFSPAQLVVLKSQIVTFKAIKDALKNGTQMPTDLADIKPPLLLPAQPPGGASLPPPSAAAAAAFAAAAQPLPGAQLGPFPGMAPGLMPLPAMGMDARPQGLLPGTAMTPAALAAAQQAAQQQQQRTVAAAAATSAAQQQASGGGAKPQSARNSGQGPIFTLSAAPKGGNFPTPPAQSGFLRPQQLRYDMAGLLQLEYQRQVERAAAARRAEVAAAKAAAAADGGAPGFRYRTHQMPIGRAALEELRLKLAERQKAVRQAVQLEAEEMLQVQWVLRWRGGLCACG